MLADCHTHLDRYPDEEIPQILNRARRAGVEIVISAGVTLSSSMRCVQLASAHSGLYTGVGLHPLYLTGQMDESTFQQLRSLALSSEKVIVISETGLEFSKGAPDGQIQRQAFRHQIRLARELNMPVVFHSVEAHQESFRILEEERAYEVGAVMHYFQGDEKTARRCIDLGFHLSLAKPLLRLPHLQAMAARLPLEYLLLESDSYPQPYKPTREEWTEPRHITDVAEKLAQLRGMTLEEVGEVTTKNLLRLLGSRASTVQPITAESKG